MDKIKRKNEREIIAEVKELTDMLTPEQHDRTITYIDGLKAGEKIMLQRIRERIETLELPEEIAQKLLAKGTA